MRRKELEILLQRIPPHPRPVAGLEQVNTPAAIASDALYTAHSMGDIEGRRVADLGCGTGIFGIGAYLLGAEEVFAVDVDKDSIAVGRSFAESIGASLEWIVDDVAFFNTGVDTILMNPPFGAQKRHADRPFLESAMRCSSTAYTFCLTTSTDFLESFSTSKGWRCVSVRSYKFPIPYTHPFHRKEKKVFDVSFLRMSSNGGG